MSGIPICSPYPELFAACWVVGWVRRGCLSLFHVPFSNPNPNAQLQVRRGLGPYPPFAGVCCSNFEASREVGDRGWSKSRHWSKNGPRPVLGAWKLGPDTSVPCRGASRLQWVGIQGTSRGDDPATRSDDTKSVPWDGTAPRPACRRGLPLPLTLVPHPLPSAIQFPVMV